MVSPAGTSPPKRRIGMTPPKRQKYRAARAFYLILLVFAVIAAWNIITDHTGGRGGDGARIIQRRSASTVLYSTKKHAVVEDQEVFIFESLAHIYILRYELANTYIVQPGSPSRGHVRLCSQELSR